MALTLREGKEYSGQEIIIERPDGTRIVGLAHANPIRNEQGQVIGAVNVLVDITERKLSEQRLATRDHVTRILAQSESLDEAASEILQAICNHLGWQVGALWYVDSETNQLRCADIYCQLNLDVAQFEAVTRQRTFQPGVGLPGRVWASGRAAWIRDVVLDENFPRAPYALAAGLHGAFGFPIILKDEVLGVIEFFSHEIRQPDADLLRMMTAIGSQVGQFIERKRAEAALQHRERDLADFFDNAMLGLHWVGPDGIILRVNQSELDMLGYRCEEFVGRHIAEFHVDRNVIDDMSARLMRGESVHDQPARLRCKDGSIRDVLISSNGLFEEGRFIHTRCFTRDITELKRAEQALRESEERYRSLSQAITSIVWTTDADGRFVSPQSSWSRYTGQSWEELREFGWKDALHPEDQIRVVQLWEAACQSRSWYKSEGRLWHAASKEYRHFEARGVPIVNADGSVREWVGTYIDVEDRKRSEAALLESEQRFRQFGENITDVFWIFDLREPLLLYVSPACEAVWGRNRQSLYEQPRSFLEAVHEGDRPRVAAALERQARGELTVEEYRVVRPDRSIRWVLDRAFPIRDERGNTYRVAGIAEDITERKLAEERLRHSERVSRFLSEATMALASLTDYETTLRRVAEVAVPFFADWCVVDINEAGGALRRLAIVHVDPAKIELVNELQRRYPPRPTDPNGPHNVVRTGQPEMVDDIPDELLAAIAHDEDHLRLLRGLGLRSYICAPLVARGRIIGALSFVTAESGRAYSASDMRLAQDLAHRAALAVDNARLYQTAQDALRQKEETLAILDTLQHDAPVGFAFVDRNFRYVRINEALAKIDGNPVEFHIGRTVMDSVPELWPSLEPLYRRVLEAGEPVTNQEVTGETPALPGELRHWLVSYYPVRVHEEIVGVGILVTDITHRKRLEQELREQARQLAEADRRKDEFLATLAHELRNPLAPICNAIELMKRACGDGATVEHARAVVERQLHHMVRLIDDLLDISRISRGKLALRRERIELGSVLQTAIETARPLIESARHELTVSLPPAPVFVDADPIRLAQVFANLLNNAAKYTDRGGHIWLSAERRDCEISVSVRDTGIGILSEHLPRIFDMFSQVEPALTRSQGGLGIGLSLVRGLVELHGGRIEARSGGLGLGSEFTISLPALDATAQSREPNEDPSASRTGPTRRILVVDDNRDHAGSLAMLLRLIGHDVQIAYDGLEAVHAAGAFRPDIVLLDVGLPVLNGYDAAKSIRAEPWGRNMILLALSGWGQDEIKRRALEAGFNQHMTKPVDPSVLLNWLSNAKTATERIV